MTLSFLPGISWWRGDSQSNLGQQFRLVCADVSGTGPNPSGSGGELCTSSEGRELEPSFYRFNDIIFVPYLYGSNSSPDAKGRFSLTSYLNSVIMLQAVYRRGLQHDVPREKRICAGR